MKPPADVTCPQCGDRWSIATPRSWWLFQDRCWSCPDGIAHRTPDFDQEDPDE